MLIDFFAKLRMISTMSETLTQKQMVEALRARTKKSTQRQVAAELELSPAFVCDVLSGRREVTKVLARKLGYRRVVIFQKVA